MAPLNTWFFRANCDATCGWVRTVVLLLFGEKLWITSVLVIMQVVLKFDLLMFTLLHFRANYYMHVTQTELSRIIMKHKRTVFVTEKQRVIRIKVQIMRNVVLLLLGIFGTINLILYFMFYNYLNVLTVNYGLDLTVKFNLILSHQQWF